MEIDVRVPDGTSGIWSVETFEVTKEGAQLHNMREMYEGRGARTIVPGTYKKLMRYGQVIMSNTPAEIMDHWRFIRRAKVSKNVLINGLGLGVVLEAILLSKTLEKITVIEISEDVIKLVGLTFQDDPRISIICADAYTWKPPKGIKYDAVWHDVWDNLCLDNLPQMHKLHRKYGRRTNWQASWGREVCEEERRREQRNW